MKLRISDRLLILNLIPKEGTIDTLRIVRDLQIALSFSEEEHKATHLRLEGDMFVWGDPEVEDKEAAAKAVDIHKDIEIGERAFDVIKGTLGMASSNGLLKIEYLPLYEHFCEGKEWSPSPDGQTEST